MRWTFAAVHVLVLAHALALWANTGAVRAEGDAGWREWLTASTYRTENFRILYQSDDTSTEYAQAVGDYIQQARDTILDDLGYAEPSWLEDTRLDVYIRQLEREDYLGVAIQNTRYLDDIVGSRVVANPWIEISLESKIWPEGTNDGWREHNLKQLVAHEFFHIVQFGYDVHERSWLMESTATWIEDKAHPTPKAYWTITGYRNRFGSWTRNRPSMSTLSSRDTNEYAAAAFFQYLTERRPGTNATIRKIWEEAAKTSGPNTYEAIGKAVGDGYAWGSNMRARIGDFAVATLIQRPSLHGTYSFDKLEDVDDSRQFPHIDDAETLKLDGIALSQLDGEAVEGREIRLRPFQPAHLEIRWPDGAIAYPFQIRNDPDGGLVGKLTVLVRGIDHREWDFRLVEAPRQAHDDNGPRQRFTVRKFPRQDYEGQWRQLEVEDYPKSRVFLVAVNLTEVSPDEDFGDVETHSRVRLDSDAFEVAAALTAPPIVTAFEAEVEERLFDYRPVWKVVREPSSRPGTWRTRTVLNEGIYYDSSDPKPVRLSIVTSRPVRTPVLRVGGQTIATLTPIYDPAYKRYYQANGDYGRAYKTTVPVTDFADAIRRLEAGEQTVQLEISVEGQDSWTARFDEDVRTAPFVRSGEDGIRIADWEGDHGGPGGSDFLSGRKLPIHRVKPAAYLSALEARQDGTAIYRAQWRSHASREGERQLDIGTSAAYDPDKPLTVVATFSKPVVGVKVRLGRPDDDTLPGGTLVEAPDRGPDGATEYRVLIPATDAVREILAEEHRLGFHIDALVRDGVGIDADPRTAAEYDWDDNRWYRLEDSHRLALHYDQGGTDRWHKLNAAGRSFVMLLDASGSMGDDNRMGEAKSGISEAVRSLQPNDEAALVVFFTCGDIRVVVPFTDDPEEILEGLAGIAPSGGTPLGDGIRFANRYLSDNARYQERKLLTFSDGETTCGASAATAVAEIEPEAPEEPAAEVPEEEERPREISWSTYLAGTDDSPYVASYWVDVIEYRESDFDDPARDSATLTVRRHPVAYVASRGRTVWSINWSGGRVRERKTETGPSVAALRQRAEGMRAGTTSRDGVADHVQRLIGPGAVALRAP